MLLLGATPGESQDHEDINVSMFPAPSASTAVDGTITAAEKSNSTGNNAGSGSNSSNSPRAAGRTSSNNNSSSSSSSSPDKAGVRRQLSVGRKTDIGVLNSQGLPRTQSLRPRRAAPNAPSVPAAMMNHAVFVGGGSDLGSDLGFEDRELAPEELLDGEGEGANGDECDDGGDDGDSDEGTVSMEFGLSRSVLHRSATISAPPSASVSAAAAANKTAAASARAAAQKAAQAAAAAAAATTTNSTAQPAAAPLSAAQAKELEEEAMFADETYDDIEKCKILDYSGGCTIRSGAKIQPPLFFFYYLHCHHLFLSRFFLGGGLLLLCVVEN